MKKWFYLLFVSVGSVALCIVLVFGLIRISYPLKYKKEVAKYCEKYGLEIAFVLAIIKTESSFNKNAISSAGAVGLMQIMPDTAYWIASVVAKDDFEYDDLFNPETNIEFGCFYLNYLNGQFEDRDKILCAYNLGETTTRSLVRSEKGFDKQIVEYNETYNFIKRVNKSASIYRLIA